MDDEDCNIRVICRFRPVNNREREEGVDAMANQIKFTGDTTIDIGEFEGRPPQNFVLDNVFHDPLTTQEEIYNKAARKSIDDVIKGYNATIFAYGQTGAGKSFTMFGPDVAVPHLKGIIPRACMHIFDYIANDKEGTEYTIKCSFLEIYKEVIRDLLNPATHGNKQGLKVRETPSRGVWVEGLREEYVSCEDDVINLIQLGEKYRAVSSTKMNAVSSRSHSLFILTLHQKTKDGSTKEGRLNLADLAGSEKISKTGASGETLEEAKKINQSLSALGNCINALTKSKKGHIPYRDSKLTFILRESLGGNCKTTLLVACSPHIFNLGETIGTLMFAKRAKTIKNSVKVNKQRSVAELMAIIEKLKKELTFLKKYSVALEQFLEQEKGPDWKNGLPDFADEIASSKKAKAEPSKNGVANGDGGDEEEGEEDDEGRGNGVRDNQNTITDDNNAEEQNEENDEIGSTETFLHGGARERLAQLQELIKNTQEETASKISSLKDEIEILKKENAPLLESVNIKKKIIKELDDNLKQCSLQLENAKQQKDQLESRLAFQLTQSQIKKEEQERHITSMSEHNASLKPKVEGLMNEIEDINNKIAKAESDKKEIEAQMISSQEKLTETEKTIKELEVELSSAIAAQKSLKNRQFELSHIIKNLEQKVSNQESQISHQQQIGSELQAKLQSENEENAKLQTELDEINSKIDDFSEILAKVQTELEVAQRIELEMKQAGEKSLADLQITSISVKHFANIKRDKEKCKTHLENIQANVENEEANLQLVLKELEEQTEHQKSEMENTDRLYEVQMDNLKMRYEIMESQLLEEEEMNKSKILQIEKKIEETETKFNTQKTARLKLEDELHKKSEHVTEKDKEIRHITNDQSNLERAIAAQISTIQSQEKSLQSLVDRLKEQENELNLLLQEKENLEQEIKTAIEINIENTKQFEDQLNQARDSMRSKIRVPVKRDEGTLASFFGFKTMPTISEITTIKEGFLLRRSYYLRIWEERYIVLSDKCLFIFESNKPGMKADLEIEISTNPGTIISPASKATGKANSFGVFQPGKKDNFFQARNSEEASSWMNSIQNIIPQVKTPPRKPNTGTPKNSPGQRNSPFGTPTQVKTTPNQGRSPGY